MAVSQSDIDALNAAIASPERQVTQDGQSVTYQTIDSLIRARDDMAAQLAKQNVGSRRARQTQLVYGGRGFD